MSKKVIITGSSGMVGSLVLQHCLSSSEITQVTSLVRRKTDHNHPKLKEVVISNFADYSAQVDLFQNIDIAFFCIGVYTGQVPDEKFKEITVDYAVAFAEALKTNSADATLCLLSGAGADRTEKSRVPFAKYKGMAENKIAELKLGGFYAFRPGYIYPVQPRKEPNFMYTISRALYPLIKMMGSNSSIKSTELAAGMFHVGLQGAKNEILENRDILTYA
ncbi:MAG: NAD-dependent epimerase/dehydratase family protein [Bacteroidota bacterium]